MSAFLEITNLTKHYGSTRALEDVSISVEQGSAVAVLGPNGAGKSTLFGCLLGLIRPDCGEMQWGGRRIDERSRAGFGYVAERVALYSQRTVLENAVFFAQLKGLGAPSAERGLKRLGLDEVRERKARELSKGQLQRLGLAIALCGEPELLILDEPFNGLDPALLDTLQRILREEVERGATLLISTHTMSAVEQLATHVAILLRGGLAAFATLEELRAEHAPETSLESIYHRIARQQLVMVEEGALR